MGIPADEKNPKKLHEFFFEKFNPPEEPEFEHNVPSKPQLEILNARIFGHVQDENNKKEVSNIVY
jgi:hypothetical protein